jgi:hypothetical protein
MNALMRHGLEIVNERGASSPKAQKQPPDLHETLTRAVAAGRRRGFGRRGRCISCLKPLAAHFAPARNEFIGC